MAAGRTQRRAAYRKRYQNRFSMFLVTIVVVLILIVVTVKRVELNQERDANQTKIDQLNEQIADAEAEAESIQEYEKYTKTKAFVEKMAHDRLGLVYENEIIFKEED